MLLQLRQSLLRAIRKWLVVLEPPRKDASSLCIMRKKNSPVRAPLFPYRHKVAKNNGHDDSINCNSFTEDYTANKIKEL